MAQLARLAGLSMHFELSASDRVTVNGWVQILCPLSTLARWSQASGQCKLIGSHAGISKVSVIDRCPLWESVR